MWKTERFHGTGDAVRREVKKQMKILVSACLLGENCKYNGKNNYNEKVAEFAQNKEIIPICPEMLAGMPSPRPCVELVHGAVVDENGVNVDEIYRSGVKRALEEAERKGIDLAILQSRSPTCGVRQIYDGSFSGCLIEGQGLFAEALIKNGYQVIDAEEVE